VQQGLATAEQMSVAALAVRKDRRRRLVHEVLLDLLGGARSLGEIDVARECRRRGLPEPSRQVLRQDGPKRYFLDVFWDDWGLVVEIDGIQHTWAENVVGDALRQNAVSLQGLTVLRLPLLGLRTAREEFFDQIESALRSAGWPLAA
jgi:very-short-patch-repair endonuclease